MRLPKFILNFLFCICFIQASAQKIIVDINGQGNFTSIQAAINSLSDSAAEDRIIFIKNGLYAEKVFISKNNIVLQGQDKEKTIISQSIARDEWRCSNIDDWGVATINLKGSNITLQNLTITNNYGFVNNNEIIINCTNDSSGKKKVRKDGHQMALRSFSTTKLKVINCNLKAFGGDTVSPWNTDAGMFYFKDCLMEGGVDFYCPRGWAYAENCKFYSHSGSAAIWHDGSKNQDSKTVLVNCFFDGFEGFKLGRWHRDAQFYLINCTFSQSMSNTPIYKVPTNNITVWGDDRQYYFNCHRVKGDDFTWYANNLNKAPNSPNANQINAQWVFGSKWIF